MLSLCCSDLQAKVDPRGAELRSLRRGSDEYLWQNESGVWPHAAPILFPYVGRLRGGGYRHRGRWYTMGTHGFAAQAGFEVLEHEASRLRLRLRNSAPWRPVYPFEFCLSVSFDLAEDGLAVRYEVRNEDEQHLHFGLGSHPAIALDQGPPEAWQVRFEQDEVPGAFRLEAGLLARQPEALPLIASRRLPLRADLFDRDALIMKNIRSRHVDLLHAEHGLRMRLHTGGAPHLGLWAKPGQPYLCIEPWHGVDDDDSAPLALADKPEIVHLAPDEEFFTGYRLEPGP